jgi:MFS transporter, DHA1 family, multidrug resistance protein
VQLKLLTALSTLAASIYAPGHLHVARQFSVSTTVALLPLSFYNLGMAIGPILNSPLSETLGRKKVYLVTTPTYAFFALGSGFANGIASLTICRFFAGVFASPGVSIASATISDMTESKQRAVPMAFYYCTPFVGSLLG